MPRALYSAANQRSIRKRPTAMGAMVAEGEQPFRTAAHHHTLAAHVGQHHLAVAEFTLIAHRPAPALECPALELSSAGVTMVDANLIAINQRPAQPARDPRSEE